MARKQNALLVSVAAILFGAQLCYPQPENPDKVRAEIDKLHEEIRSLQNTNTPQGRTLNWFQAVGLGTIVGGILVWFIGRDLSNSQHNLKLFEALGSTEPRIRVGAISGLAERARKRTLWRHRPTILRVLIAATKHEDNEDIQKHIADEIVRTVFRGDSNRYESGSESPLKEFNFQGARLTNAWWKGVDARATDFYRAQLRRAGLAQTKLESAVFKNADLTEATLRQADARQASFEGANMTRVKASGIDLTNANLREAILVGADLRNAVVAGADFSNAKLRGAKLQGVDLTSAKSTADTDLASVEVDVETKLPDPWRTWQPT